MHYKHMFLRGTYEFNQFFSGSEHYTDICYAYTGNVIMQCYHLTSTDAETVVVRYLSPQEETYAYMWNSTKYYRYLI